MPAMFGLSEKTIQKIRDVFAKFPDVEQALLYGSRAKGNYKPGSDIDLTLKGSKLTVNTLRAIDHELNALELAYKIDLSVYHLIDDPDVIGHIDRVGKQFYKRVF
jgi:predicted nucleotidyltransferase